MTPAKPPAPEPIDAVYTSLDGPLRYSVRSLARHAPWIRKVHFVSTGDAPPWIKNGERTALVRREDLPGDRPPEWQLYRIPGISRQFLWMDSALLLGRRLELADFLTARSGHRFFVGDAEIPVSAPSEALLNSRFGKRGARKMPAGAPRLLERNFLEEVNRLWEPQIKSTAGLSLECLYFYYLLESPLQYGIHERTPVDEKTFRAVEASSAGQAWGMTRAALAAAPQFIRLRIADGAPASAARAMRMALWLSYWRKSAFEK